MDCLLDVYMVLSVHFSIKYNDEMYELSKFSKKGMEINRTGGTPKAVGVAALWALAPAIYISSLINQLPINN